ncbi:branchpoint-bridging protein [Cladophialophora immunda]|uniref:Branchpoint-bridging protein n=2 Tax=Eurotiomycetes TaxID=147545 RepID=A0A0D2AK99_9EURO|nr:branchpoint-bridging protein [Cladophialophora immunda]KIW25377.1 branchpoint-bridging protein [Cladophialophora immunda]
MAWRNQGITGSNNIPLGTRRRFGGEGNGDSQNDSSANSPAWDDSSKRGRSPTRAEPAADGVKRRRKRNRWGEAGENKAAGLMGLPTMIQANMTAEQLEAYALHLRIEEISQKLRINDVVPAEADRSPSPPPQYDNFGRRVNTREFRYRKRLEEERHKLIEKAMKTIPNYHPPSDYRRPTKTQEKVYVPVNDYPEINFIGLLIGPRGNTLKKMESESGAKIAIRGKGSVKEGKGRSDAAHTSNQEEDLHCLIMADTEEKVNRAKALIHNVIETAASIPEGQNELKRNQLRELATLNGTLRDDENQACQNCGQIGHRKYDCPEQRNFTANIICRVCGNAGHMARDCPDRQRGTDMRNNIPGGYGGPQRRLGAADAVDREMENLMQELSGNASGNGPAGRIEAAPGGYDQGDSYTAGGDSRPWARQPTGGVAPWQRDRQERQDRDYGHREYGQRGYESRDHGHRDGDSSLPPWAQSRGGDAHGGYGAAPAQAAAPWQQPQHQQYQQHQQQPPPAQTYGYGGYHGYDAQPSYGVPPPPAPPGLSSFLQQYGGGVAPPPPPDSQAPPPPPDQPPPPPGMRDYYPPPPPSA